MSLKSLVSSLLAVVLAAAAACAATPEVVPVGNPGNAADTTGFGAVAYKYHVGKYEVTIEQYCEFLNAAAKSDPHELYDPRMESGEEDGWGGIKREGDSGNYKYSVVSGRGKQPIGYVTWLSCVRYCNWLSNGQGSGDTEKGVYIIEGDWPDKVKVPDHAALAKGAAAKWVLTSENEWYKAAYYDPNKTGGAGYWLFPVKSDNVPEANVNSNWPTEVGKYKKSASAYGTYDQGGNQWEYNDNVADEGKVGLRGGSWYLNDNENYMRSTSRYDVLSAKWPHYGFRVTQLGGDASK